MSIDARPEAAAIRRRRENERGAALLMAMFVTVFTMGVIVSGTALLRANRARTETAFRLDGQATQCARAGLVEATNWLRRQESQPVTEFAPRLDERADPAVLDTAEPEVGLVREFRISGRMWGRYEVWREWADDPDPERAAWRGHMAVTDVSALRGRTGHGAVWNLRSLGYVFEREDDDVPFDSTPNRVLAREILMTEVSRLTITPPGQAALCVRSGRSTRINRRGEILGGTTAAGIYYGRGTGRPRINRGRVRGRPRLSQAVTYDDSCAAVFGVSEARLRSMADYRIESARELPNPIPDGSLVFVDGDLTCTRTKPLNGHGIIYCKGHLTIESNSSSFFKGMVYAARNFRLHSPATIHGMVIVAGSATVTGGSDMARVAYDDKAINDVQDAIGTYRVSRATRRKRAID